jgi:hypothetical protein
MTPYPGYIEQPGLQAALAAAGITFWWQNGEAQVSDLAAAQAVVAAYNPLPAMQAAATAQVKAQLAKLIAAGCTYQGVLVAIDADGLTNINSWQARALANLQATTLGLTVAAWSASFVWLPQGDGATLPLSTAQAMVEFASVVTQYVSDIIVCANTLESQIAAADSVAALQAINLTSNWPSS